MVHYTSLSRYLKGNITNYFVIDCEIVVSFDMTSDLHLLFAAIVLAQNSAHSRYSRSTKSSYVTCSMISDIGGALYSNLLMVTKIK